MAQVNRYYRFSKMSEAKFRRLVRCFAEDLTATETAKVTGLSVRSVNAIYLRMRSRMEEQMEVVSPMWTWTWDLWAEGKISNKEYEDLTSFDWAPRMKKFNGVPRRTRHLHARETEFRLFYNKQLYKTLLKLLRLYPL